MMPHAHRRRHGIPFVFALMALVCPAGDVAGQQTWLGWTAYWENDSFQSPITSSDANYTNGVRIAVVRDPLENPSWLEPIERRWRDSRLVRDRFVDLTVHPVLSLVLGHNIFTPNVITDHDVDPRDRPFAGLLYAGLRLDLTEFPQDLGWAGSLTLQHAAEVDAGVMGPPAFGRQVQTGVHVLRTSRIPKGWSHQLGFDPLLQASYMVRGRLGGSILDVTPHLGAMIGNPQTLAFGGVTARLGIHLSGFPTLLIPMTVADSGRPRPDWEFALLAGVEGRAFAHNALLDGGIIGSDTLSVPGKALVGDIRLGASLRLTDWRLSYTWVRRSAELEEGPFSNDRHDYGSLAVSYEPFGSTAGERAGTFLGCLMDVVLGTAFENVFFEAAIGRGSSDVPGAGERNGVAMHASVGKGLFGNRVILGGEMTGIAREGPVPVPGENHTDEFLRSRLATVRVRPLGATTGPGILHVRAGAGRGIHRLQVLAPLDERVAVCPPGTARDGADDGKRCSATEAGTAVMLGGGYALSLGAKVSIGLDLSWNRIALDAGDETFFVPALTMRYHPWG
jgi:hypothetical protein